MERDEDGCYSLAHDLPSYSRGRVCVLQTAQYHATVGKKFVNPPNYGSLKQVSNSRLMASDIYIV
ncbi:MAG: hypothetical protein ACFB4I_01270 [Cyanophyceae cyanobacterium]